MLTACGVLAIGFSGFSFISGVFLSMLTAFGYDVPRPPVFLTFMILFLFFTGALWLAAGIWALRRTNFRITVICLTLMTASYSVFTILHYSPIFFVSIFALVLAIKCRHEFIS